jgi:hypothetical protein
VDGGLDSKKSPLTISLTQQPFVCRCKTNSRWSGQDNDDEGGGRKKKEELKKEGRRKEEGRRRKEEEEGFGKLFDCL